MFRKITINILGDRNILDNIYTITIKNISTFDIKHCQNVGGRITLVLDENSKEYIRVIELSKKYQLSTTLSNTAYYTQAEIEKIEYFSLRIPYPLELEGKTATDYGTHYIGGCQTCGLGKKPDGDVFIEQKLIKKYNIGNLYPDIFVSESVRDLIQKNELSGASFERELKDCNKKKMLKYYIMNINNVLAPMSNSTWIIKDNFINKKYETCGHQVIYLRSDCQYEKEKLNKSQDFNLSHEYLDNFRLQEIIVSARVRKIFKQNKVHCGFSPVTII